MRFRFFLAAVSTFALGCNLITGVGNLTFSDDAAVVGDGAPASGGDGGGVVGSSSGGASDGGSGGTETGPTGPVAPSGNQVVTSATITLEGMTSDGYAVYGDTSTNTLSVVGVEQADGGPALSTTPVSLGTADLATVVIDGELALFFSGGESEAGPTATGTLSAWSAATGPVVIGAGAMLPDLSNSYYPFGASPDGRYVAYLGAVAADGATATLYLSEVAAGTQTPLLSSIDVLEDGCQPRVTFSGDYVVAAYCQVPSGAMVPDAGTPYMATLASFLAPGGTATTLATAILPGFVADTKGGFAITYNASGLVSTAVTGAGGLVLIDPSANSAFLSSDGTIVVYATIDNALKRASTSPPANVTSLVPGSFANVDGISTDNAWAIGDLDGGLSAASATTPGAAIALAAGETGKGGDSFTTDGKYALYLTSLASIGTGTMTAYPLASGSAGSAVLFGAGAFEDVAVGASGVVFNVNYTSGKADILWADLATTSSPTTVVTQADEFFVVGPAKDKIVYTYSGSPATADGLWIIMVPGTVSSTCGDAGTTAYHPPAGKSGDCTSAEVSTYDSACINSTTANQTDCTAVSSTVSATCLACLFTGQSDSSWGVLIDNPAAGGVDELNAGGCCAAAGDMACAAAQETALQCANNACTSQPDLTSFETCFQSAQMGECACYVTAAGSACAPFTSSPCNPTGHTTVEQGFLDYTQVMCE